MDHYEAGLKADELIAKEVAGQDKMWGVANERTDSNDGQLLLAGTSQALALIDRRQGDEDAFESPPDIYPVDWSGFRDYGSDVANIVVAIAFLRQEAKRLIASGADTTRKSRQPTQVYTGDQPAQPFPAADAA
jgi:hypothetical protein